MRAKAIVVAFSVSGISKYGNKKDGNSVKVNSTQLEVSGEFILCYLLFSRLAVEPKRTPVRTRVIFKFEKICGIRTRVLTAFEKLYRFGKEAQFQIV